MIEWDWELKLSSAQLSKREGGGGSSGLRGRESRVLETCMCMCIPIVGDCYYIDMERSPST